MCGRDARTTRVPSHSVGQLPVTAKPKATPDPACQSQEFRVGFVVRASRPHIDNHSRLCYPAPMMTPAVRNRLIIGAAAVAAAVFLTYQMYYSQTPARHADHDHAIAKIDAGGFLWVEAQDGERRNLVGAPEKVLVLHWFDPTATNSSEETAAADFAASVADDPMVEVVFVADAPSWEGIEAWANAASVPMDLIYLDEKGKTGGLFGVRRLPETLVYDPNGLLAHQARGPMDWTSPGFRSEIERAKGGVEEIH